MCSDRSIRLHMRLRPNSNATSTPWCVGETDETVPFHVLACTRNRAVSGRSRGEAAFVYFRVNA